MAAAKLLRRQSGLYEDGLSTPAIGAALAFAIINLIAYVVIFGFACTVRPFVPRNSYTRTRFGLIWVLVFTILAQCLDVATTVVEAQIDLPRSYFIVRPFQNFFVLAADVTLVWTLFGFLYARMHALHGENSQARGTRIAGIVMISFLPVLMAVYLGLYCASLARSISGSSVSLRTSILRIYQAMYGIQLAFDAIRLALSIVFLGLGGKVFTDYRRSSNFSKIPLILISVVFPFYFLVALAVLAIDAAYDFGRAEDYLDLPIIEEIVRNLFLAVVLAGLVAAGRCPDWAPAAHGPGPHDGSFNPGFNPGFDPTHFAPVPHYGHAGAPHHHQHQHHSSYGGNGTSVMSGSTALGGPEHGKSELGTHATPYPELPPHQHHMGHAPQGHDPFFRGNQRNSELDAGGVTGYRGAGSPPPQHQGIPDALRTGSPPAPAEMQHTPRRF